MSSTVKGVLVILTFCDDAVLLLEGKPVFEPGAEDQMWVHFVFIDLRFILQVTCRELIFIIVKCPTTEYSDISNRSLSGNKLGQKAISSTKTHQFETPIILARPKSFSSSMTAQASRFVRLSFFPLGGKCKSATST